MSDEMLNNSEGTEALFVAKQKKKEEDKKAALEEAERKRKEEEVARMEAEIKERKAKAFKGRIIAIGLGAIVVIITMFVILNLNKAVSDIGKMDYASLNFDSEYTPQSSDHQVKIKYPGELYGDVKESTRDENGIILEFAPSEEKLVTTKVTLDYLTESDVSTKLVQGNVSTTTPEIFMSSLKSYIEDAVSEVVPGAAVSDSMMTDYTTDSPGKYYYSCSFTSVENSGGMEAWFEIADDGVLEIVGVFCLIPGDDPTDGIAMRDAFVAGNSDDAILVAGMNPPPKDAALDGQIEYPEIDLTLQVPKDMFYPLKRANYMIFGDLNGGTITIAPIEYEQGFANSNFDKEKLYAFYQTRAEESLGQMLIGTSNKEQLSSDYTSITGDDYSMTYTFDWGGKKYVELFLVTPWASDAGKDYFVEMEFIFPYENMDEYNDIFESTISNLFETEE